MANEGKSVDDLSKRPLDRELIDKIVEEQMSLPDIENFDQKRRKLAWNRLRDRMLEKRSQKLPAQDDYHFGWEVEFLELSSDPKSRFFFEIGGMEKDDPLPLEVAIAYAHCLTLRPELWRDVLNTRAVSPLFETIDNRYGLTESQFVRKHGKSVGVVDYDLHRNFYQRYGTYFRLKYGTKCKFDSYMTVRNFVQLYAEAGHLDEDALRAYILQSCPDCFV